MKDQDQDLMERYIYQVVRRVDKNQRDEIALELRELIEEMSEESGMELTLEKLGDPAEFAKKYRDNNGYLIGPNYYDNYIWVLKIVCLCVIGLVVVSAIISCMIDGNWRELPESIIGNAVVSLMSIFGTVTFVFAVLERQNIKVELKKEMNWSGDNKIWEPKHLEPLPNKKALISRSESIVNLVFMILFGGLLALAPQLIGAYVFEESEFARVIPLFNLEKWHVIMPILLLGLFFELVNEVIRLVNGRYGNIVMVSCVIANVASLVLAVIALKMYPFWNPSFLEEVRQEFGRTRAFSGDFLNHYGTDLFSNMILGIICIAAIIEVGNTIYKTMRYGEN